MILDNSYQNKNDLSSGTELKSFEMEFLTLGLDKVHKFHCHSLDVFDGLVLRTSGNCVSPH